MRIAALARNFVTTKVFPQRDPFLLFVPIGVTLDFITTSLDVFKFGIAREHSVIVRILFSTFGPTGLVVWFFVELLTCLAAVVGVRMMGNRLNVHRGVAPSVFLGMFVFVALVNISSFLG